MAQTPATGHHGTAAEGQQRLASRAPTIRLGLAAFLLCSVLGCTGGPSGELKQIRFAEQILGTAEEELAWNFHALLEYKSTDNDVPTGGALPDSAPGDAAGASANRPPDFCQLAAGQAGEVAVRGLGLHFPGYLLGIEKASRRTLGLLGGPFSTCADAETEEIFRQSFLRAPQRSAGHFDDPTCLIKRRLDDRRRMFLSHIVAFRPLTGSGTQRIGGSILYDVYARNDLLCTIQKADLADQLPEWKKGIFVAGREEGIARLEQVLQADLRRARENGMPYSHVFIYVMGWNTGEAASIENFNALYGYLLDAAAADTAAGKDFRPLFIGLSWPSAWSFGTGVWDNILRALSFWNKKNDADELGATWANYLVNDVLTRVKRQQDGLRVVLVGHSFGARAVSRALYSCAWLPAEADCQATVDLVVGLQAAFGRSRFRHGLAPTWQEAIAVHPMHHEGAPHTDYSQFAAYHAKQVYVWSRYDSATSLSAMMGGSNAIERTREPANQDLFAHLDITPAVDDHGPVAHSSAIVARVGTLDAHDRRVLLIDGAGFVRHDTPYHGGDAHSDIYTRETGQLTWELVKKYAPTAVVPRAAK